MIVGASLDERVPVPCHVVSNPRDVSFDWNFSNSGERFEVTSGQFNLLQDFHSSIGDSDEFGESPSMYGGSEENLGRCSTKKNKHSRGLGCTVIYCFHSVARHVFKYSKRLKN